MFLPSERESKVQHEQNLTCTHLLDTSGDCGGVNEKWLPRRLIGCSLVGGCVSLGGGPWSFRSSSQAPCHSLFLLPAHPNEELSAPSPASCLSVHLHTSSHHDGNGLSGVLKVPCPSPHASSTVYCGHSEHY